MAELYERSAPTGPYSPDPESAGLRALRNAALDLLVATGAASEIARAERHYREATNMTDAITALSILSHSGMPRRATRRSTISMRAGRTSRSCSTNGSRCRRARRGANSVETVRGAPLPPEILAEEPEPHPRADRKLRPRQSRPASTAPTAAGYRLLADQALEIDRFNPHVAARLLGAFESWRILEPRSARPTPRRRSRTSRPTACPPTATRSSQRPWARLESARCQRVINRISTAFLWTDDALIDSNGDEGDSEMRQLLRLEAGERQGDRMARARSAREGFALAGPHWQDLRAIVGRHLPDAERVRRLVPLLLAGFACRRHRLGFAVQLIHGKRAAFDAASHRLELIADSTALNLKDKTLSSSSDWQRRARRKPAQGRDRRRSACVLLADAEGNIQARAPLDGARVGNLLTILGPQQPLTTFGAEAGVLRLTLLDGTDAIVTVAQRAADRCAARVHPAGRRGACRLAAGAARLEITLLVLTGLVLALLAGGLWYLAPATSARADEGALAKELTEALPGCGVWRWNLARGHVHWSAPMYRLLGLEPSDKAMAFGAIARALHPEDDLRGEIDRHLREGLLRVRRLLPAAPRRRPLGSTLRLRGHITRTLPDREPCLTGIAVIAEQDARSRLGRRECAAARRGGDDLRGLRAVGPRQSAGHVQQQVSAVPRPGRRHGARPAAPMTR